MLIGHVEGATRILGKGQEDYQGLPVRDFKYPDGRVAMMSAWMPTPAEISRLIRGEAIYLVVMGEQHPPVALVVGDSEL